MGGEEAVDAVQNDLRVHPDRRGHDGDAAGHVLEKFHAAFTAFPRRVRQRCDADAELRQLAQFRLQLPRTKIRVEAELRRVTRGDDAGRDSQRVERRLERFEVRERRAAADPADEVRVGRLRVVFRRESNWGRP